MNQPHTFLGERGQTQIHGITYADLYRIILARLEFYDSDTSDPEAFCQKVCCEVEKAMGIYPNVPKIRRRIN
jgi:hypothetical protein